MWEREEARLDQEDRHREQRSGADQRCKMDAVWEARDMRAGGDSEVASVANAAVPAMQLQDIKEEEDVELRRLDSGGSSVSRGSEVEPAAAEQMGGGGGAVVSGGDGSRDDLSLLPPLPSGIERVVEQDEEEVERTGCVEEPVEAASDAASQFDLSKALEIPVSFGGAANGDTSTINNMGSHSDSSLSLTPLITSPKLSLKKKFTGVTPEGSPSETLDARAHSIRNRSNSNVAAFQHILPALNMAIDPGSHDHHQYHYHHHHHYQPRASADRKSVRKFSFGDSSSVCTSHNSASETELLYKAVPPMLNRQSRSRSCSNPPNSIEGSNTPNSSLLENDLSPKKVPLLRRASSAILRKASLRASKDAPRSSSASTTPVLHSGPTFEPELPVRTPCRGSRSLLEGAHSMMNGLESDEELLYVTSLNGTPDVPFRNPSIRSRVRRGFSRIISSSGSVRRVASSRNGKEGQLDEKEQEQSGMTPLSTAVSNSVIGSGSSKNSSPTEARKRESNPLVTPVSTSTAMTPITSKTLNQNFTTDSKSQGVASSAGDYFDQPGGFKGHNSEDSSKPNSLVLTDTVANEKEVKKDVGDIIENDITVDLDKLTQSIPIITVTDKINSKDCTSIQSQSNIILDEVYHGKNYKNDKRYIGGTHDNHDESNKPEMMTLSEYTNVLMRQQQIEDERLAALEKNFRDSGWCSNVDLMNLKQKRIIISKKWAERISFYQNKLDS